MSERQQRTDMATANAVARGLNILGVRGEAIAQSYMRHKGVPDAVIARVIAEPALRRPASAEQSISEAIIPSPRGEA
jgi:hypothetical protein